MLVMLSTLIDYCAGIGLSRTDSRKIRQLILSFSLGTNLGLLFTFKYLANFADYFLRVIESPPLKEGWISDLILPLGISFYTFQTLSYTIDVYRYRRQPEAHFGIFALYVVFFPQLLAGPIERSNTLLPQLRREFPFDINRVSSGLLLMLVGYCEKFVIGERLGFIEKYRRTVANRKST